MTTLETLNHFRGQGISAAKAHALLAVASNPPMKCTDLAGVLAVSAAAVTQLADQLETLGLVERLRCQHDRRVTWLAPTVRAFKIIEETEPTETPTP